MERIHITKRMFERNIKRLQCPHCHSPMKAVVAGSLLCKKGHAFDFSKRGYVNLAGRGEQNIYDKTLFQARRSVFETALYTPLVQAIGEIILQQDKGPDKKGLMLDAGCGEGYYLKQLAALDSFAEQYVFCGIDLSKEGIVAAAGSFEKALWAVADLTNLPLRNRSVQVLLNILSPANYGEFFRVLNQNGIIIKVVPESGYLKEVRQILQQHLESKEYSNDEVMGYAQKHMKIIEHRRLTYERKVMPEVFRDIIKMTPMSAGLSEQEKEQAIMGPDTAITIDLSIIAGIKK